MFVATRCFKSPALWGGLAEGAIRRPALGTPDFAFG
jgi:hypothetical protein